MVKYNELSADEKTAFWQDHIKRWGKSDLSQSEYCKEHGLNKNAFTWRKRSLEGATRPRMTKIPERTIKSAAQPEARLLLSINKKLTINIEKNFDSDLLIKLLKTLDAYNENQLV